MAVTILLGGDVTLLIKLQADLLNATLMWSVSFIANARLELVYRGDINKSFECVIITDNKFSKSSGMNHTSEHIHKFSNNMRRQGSRGLWNML